MAEAGQQRALTTAFAPPPPLWKHFNTDNIKRLEGIKKEASKGEDGKLHTKKWSPAELRALDLPPELRYLVPPEIPTTGHYSVFGELQNVRFFSLILSFSIAYTMIYTALDRPPLPERTRHRTTLPLLTLTYRRSRSRIAVETLPAVQPRLLPPQNQQIPPPELPRVCRRPLGGPGTI